MKTLRIAVPIPLRQLFDYIIPEPVELDVFQPGIRVQVPFQHKEVVGIFVEWGEVVDPSVIKKLKNIIAIIDEKPVISEEILKLCQWAAGYYHYPIGEVLSHAIPGLLRKGKSTEHLPKRISSKRKNLTDTLKLNAEQQCAFDAIQKQGDFFHVFLLEGITGSGKTEVYLQVIAETLKKNKQVLVLVPEIGLTPQTLQRFEERFCVPVLAWHSRLSEKKKCDAWLAIKNGDVNIVIGTRSAIFSPLPDLGLIVVDEEHDVSFKQQDGFRYHARDLAILRARFRNIPVLLGSATPSLESIHNAKKAHYHHLQLLQRAGEAQLPLFKIVDIRKAPLEHGFSTALLNEMKIHLNAGNQVMLFLNRRGYAPTLLCHACGWISSCKRCDVRMTFHQSPNHLHCHHCDSKRQLPTVCEKCKEKNLIPIGLGTEKLEVVLQTYFPQTSIVRIDRDTTQKKGKLETFLNEIHSGQAHILIGTQMLAKGHHFPNVTLVAIMDADGGFFSSDFRALERTAQLVLQVAGRAGRVEKAGTVLIQTHHPDHPLLHQLINKDYHSFAQTLLVEREQALLPPFSFFALFRAEAYKLEHAMDFLQTIKNVAQKKNSSINLLGPIGAPMPKRAGRHRVQLLFQSQHRLSLQNFLQEIIGDIEKLQKKSHLRWSLDIDPVEMF